MSSYAASQILDEARGEAREWRRFVGMLLLALSPSLIVFGLVEAVAWRTGELMSPNAIARWQNEKPGRMWRGGDGRSYLTYKVARVRLLKPEVIMLGQSRARTFTAGDVKPYTFYNAGLTAWTFNQYRRFLELSTAGGYAPHVLFFNFDYWMFSKGFDDIWTTRFYEQPPTNAEAIKFVIDEWLKHPVTLIRRLPAADDLKGIYAILNGDGFGEDGSLISQGSYPADPRRLDEDGTGVGIAPVQLDAGFADEQIAAFERFVAFAHSKNVTLIGIQVPFYKKILDGLNSDPRAGMWHEFRSDARRQYFESKGIIFFDFADMPEYRDKPQYFVDSLHPDRQIFHDFMQQILADPRVKAVLPNATAG
jgi:hypothetical protein